MIDDGVVYVGTIDGAVKGLDLETGEDRWSWQGDHSLSVRVDAVADGIVYANPSDGRLLAIDIADGSERWRVQGRQAELRGGRRHLLRNPGGMGQHGTAIDTATGRVRWRFAPPSGTLASPGAGRGPLRQHGETGSMPSPTRATLPIVWHIDSPRRLPDDPLRRPLYGVDGDGAPFALRAADGSLLWHADGPVGDASGDQRRDASRRIRRRKDRPGVRGTRPHREAAEPVVAQPASHGSGLPDPFRVVRATRWRRRASR